MKTYQRIKRKDKKLNQIDHIPTDSLPQQRRSPAGSKPRTDFSLFFCSSNSNLPPDLLPESPSSKEELSTVTVASPDETNATKADILDLPLALWSESQNKRKGMPLDSLEIPALEVGSVAQIEAFQQQSSRNVDEQRSGTVRTLEFTPDKSRIMGSSDICLTPGSVVWAKNAHQLWWPAKISRVGSPSPSLNSSIEGTDGLVLVQYYGNQERAWVDPARDVSPFEDCLGERSCHPMKEFQEAFKQAIHQKEHQTSSKQLFASPEGPDCFNVQDQSPDAWNSSSSSRTESDYLGRGRSKRKRKPTVHFDEVNFPLKSAKKVRRLRIMRFLGLAAPVGSPFLQSPIEEAV